MATEAWLNTHQQLVPGTELFRSNRPFQLWAYTVSHSQLLLRSSSTDSDDTTIDVLFKPITVLKIRHVYDGLVIRCATEEEAGRIREATPGITFSDHDDRVFTLECADGTDYVVGAAIGWQEDILSRTRMSFFAANDPYEPRWPTTALGSNDAGLDVASAEDLVNVVTTEDSSAVTRERYRYVHVVMYRGVPRYTDGEATPAGAFLTQADAEDFKAQIDSKGEVDACWIMRVPIAI
ncbi:hypothetical protein [Kribbella sp. NPDC051718]|uniref:hypothetical protein n=1 Tax=Kribbella sp. NPDC051718 TaxID=3155168 RepID=UPI003438E9E4